MNGTNDGRFHHVRYDDVVLMVARPLEEETYKYFAWLRYQQDATNVATGNYPFIINNENTYTYIEDETAAAKFTYTVE